MPFYAHSGFNYFEILEISARRSLNRQNCDRPLGV